jgi:heparan-alpha-glucosaminide N-acetyltransferase
MKPAADVPPAALEKRGLNQPAGSTAAAGKGDFLRQRLGSLDAYRGLIMISLAFNGFGLAAAAVNHLKTNPDSAFWQNVHYQFEHVEWRGCGYWDLIQPSFMFMVGVSMAYSYVRREREGQSYGRMLGHAAVRSVLLMLLGVFLISNGRDSTNWSLMNVLTQIGLGYFFLFLFWRRHFYVQLLGAVLILFATWLMYVLYQAPGIDPELGAPEVGVSAEWAQKNLDGVDKHWHKNANVGHAIDRKLLNLFPQEEEFVYNSGGYQTINFLPSLATMLFGLMSGELLRTRLAHWQKIGLLVLAGLLLLGGGYALDYYAICPSIKRIWTPAWALFSTGWCLLILAGLYTVIDAIGWRRWSFPLAVVGMNSIAIYCMSQLLKPWTSRTLRTHFGQSLFDVFGEANQPIVQSTLVGLVFWLICYWMYRQKVFIRI